MTSVLQSITSIAVRCPNWVGDVVMATPVFQCLKQNLPHVSITACIRPYARGILEDNPHIDHIVDCDDRSVTGLRSFRRSMLPLSVTTGLLLTNTTHSFLTFRLAGISTVFGYRRNLRRFFLNGGPEPLRDQGRILPVPMQDYYLRLCTALGLQAPAKPRPSLFVSQAVEEAGRQRLANYGIGNHDLLVGFNPGASFGSSKCWPAENFARLAELLQQSLGCRLILFAGPGEEGIAARIQQTSNARIINTAGDRIDLAMLKPLIRRCNLLITNDTGPRHYAVAFNVPQVVLVGPTNPVFTASNLDATSILSRNLPCMPCHRKACPLGHHACMREITPEAVFEAAHRRLAGERV